MDLFFVTISIVFILFLIISYFIGIIKLSSPLVLIYLVFCFSYLINQDFEEDALAGFNLYIDKDDYNYENYALDTANKEIVKFQESQLDGSQKEIIDKISKPVVSFNPKPIVIDSNLVIQKDKIGILSKKPDLEKNEIISTKEDDEDIVSTLKLKEIMICRGVYKRNPIKPGFSFSNNVDSLFCYSKISNSGPKQEIKHIWYFNEKLITSVIYNIKTSYNYRSWSKKNISPRQIGKWRVDIVDSKNHVLGSRNFEIISLNDLY